MPGEKNFKVNEDIELAEEVLALFYEARDAILQLEVHLDLKVKVQQENRQKNESTQEKQARNVHLLVYERFQKNNKLFNKLHS